jgi:transcriptional regulator with XRE-family HTH domain
MATKPQHSPAYERLRSFLRQLREEAELTQRDLGGRLNKPQSWVYNCETGNRRVDLAEFIAWARACGVDARLAFGRFLDLQEANEEANSDPDADAGEPS